jgi:hypothetical protein
VADVWVIQIALLGGEQGSSRCIFEKWMRPIAQCLYHSWEDTGFGKGSGTTNTWIGCLSPGRKSFEDF